MGLTVVFVPFLEDACLTLCRLKMLVLLRPAFLVLALLEIAESPESQSPVRLVSASTLFLFSAMLCLASSQTLHLCAAVPASDIWRKYRYVCEVSPAVV